MPRHVIPKVIFVPDAKRLHEMIPQTPRLQYTCRSCSLRLSVQSRRHVSESATGRGDRSLGIKPARTRFAPSPTGYLHLGSLRTALFNYLYARRTGGQFLLRIEDTDSKRTVPGAEQRIIKDLRWAGLDWDEGPEVGGPCGPYRQSERTDLYTSAAETLLQSGHAYRCFCPPDRLKAKTEMQMKSGLPITYDRTCYHIPKEESDDRASRGQSHVVRLKDPERQPDFVDLVYGAVVDGQATQRQRGIFVEDPIILKTDGLPTYHLANVVDDHHMDITHVIRGAEWLISTRKHLILYEAFDWTPPQFAHVGLLLDKAGNKLSKREKAFDLSEMQRDGVLPEALNNFLALLGWSLPQNNKKDFVTMKQLEETFDLRFTKGNPIVSLAKLWFLSPKHAALRVQSGGAPFEELVDTLMSTVHEYAQGQQGLTLPILDADPATLRQYISRIIKADSKNFTNGKDFVMEHPSFFYKVPPKNISNRAPYQLNDDIDYHPQREHWSEEKVRAQFMELLPTVTNSWDHESLNTVITNIIDTFTNIRQRAVPDEERAHSKKLMAILVWRSLRSSIAWSLRGMSLIEHIEILGPEICLDRIQKYEEPKVETKYQENGKISKAVDAIASA